jgi:hypothetical protein
MDSLGHPHVGQQSDPTTEVRVSGALSDLNAMQQQPRAARPNPTTSKRLITGPPA